MVSAVRDTSRLFALSSHTSVSATTNENDNVLSRESCANDIWLYFDGYLKFQQDYKLCGMEKYLMDT
jgi:hypothetical protein